MSLNLGKPATASLTVWGGVIYTAASVLCEYGLFSAVFGDGGMKVCHTLESAGGLLALLGIRRALKPTQG